MTARTKVAGLSLIEMMIALVIGLILLLGVIQIFSASRSAFQLSEGASRAQENARFALDFLAHDIRMAGHFGCINDQAHFVKGEGDPKVNLSTSTGSGSPLDFSVSIQGYEAAGTAPGSQLTIGGTWGAVTGLPAEIQALSPAPRPGSDIIVLRYLSAEGAPVTALAVTGGNSVVSVEAGRWSRLTSNGVATPTLFGVADCSHADVFAGTSTNSSVTAAVDLSRYTAQPTGQTMLYRAESLVYYIGNGTSGEPSLRRARAGSDGAYTQNEELVEGIESLQILYGLDSTADISRLSPPIGNITSQSIASAVTTGADAAAANQWRRVGQVQVGVLARSPLPANAPSTVEKSRLGVLGVTVVQPANSDNRYRASYELTIALRNRLFGN
ncbi:type IV pilus assembly protein PilW [Xanthomonas arboricola]|uniref:PilW family protein n=1 Tax=Xanthomonas sp. 3793 TaxID=3035312 RepID=UPI0021679264|nr:PilW family protein [Xanthomonas sp. 3793]MCS3745083.1 type IV pilus assembly protein PilW [Xanthomonas sp. 3793]